MAALYNPKGSWSATVQYNYLDSVQYGGYTYICTSTGSINQEPDNFTSVWVQMPVITQEDQFYLRSREGLLQYEDARFQALTNAMANFYTMRNDQSIWGAFLRAIAMELGRFEYMYSYDIVTNNPEYLTPPDIKREYAAPLFVTGSFQQASQFDSGSFGSSFGAWEANTGFIKRTSILDTNGNLQVATTPGQSGDATPSWALNIGATTMDGSITWTNYGTAPTPLSYPVGYRDMLIDLIAAYQEGATAKSIQDVIYAYTGKNIVVEELYKFITPGGFYDQSDRNTVTVSVNVGGDDPFTDIESLTELQQITQSLYGALDLAKPAHVGLQFTTIFGADENIDCFLSPRYLTAYQMDTLSAAQQAYYTLVGYVLADPAVVSWTKETEFAVNSVIQDNNGNIQMATTAGVSGNTIPSWNTSLQGVTIDGAGSPPQNYIIWTNIGTAQITVSAYAALSASQQALYQGYYNNSNCTGAGIDDTLQIIIQQYEEPPYDYTLYQAPIYDVANPKTTLAAFGRLLISPLSATAFQQLLSTPIVWDNTSTYAKGCLVRGRTWGENGSFNNGTWTPGGWQLYRAKKKNSGQDPLADANQTYWVPLSSPSIYQAYYQAADGTYVIGIRQWSPSTPFFTGQLLIDNNGGLQIASSGDSPQSPPLSPPLPGLSSPIATVGTSYNAVIISGNQLILVVNSTEGMGLASGVSLITLLGFIYATFLNGQTLQVVDFTSTTITMTFVHDDYQSETQLESTATAQIGFSQSATVPTYDGTIVWRFLSATNPYNDPTKWIQIVGNNDTVTGEVSNWDINHQYGLLAPRQDLAWEISGKDTSFISAIE